MELRHYASIMLKGWWLIVTSVIVAGVASYLGARSTPRTYQSRTTIMVGQVLQSPNPSSALQQGPVENLSILFSGPMLPNPSDLLGSRRMGDLIETLRQQTDVVIFDSPPVMADADATILAARVDGVLLVIDSGNTRRGPALRGKESLEAVGARLTGVVLNRLTGGERSYDYYYSAEDGQHRKRRSGNWLARLFGRDGHAAQEADAEVEAKSAETVQLTGEDM